MWRKTPPSMQSNHAANLFHSHASLAQGKHRASKAVRTAHGVKYGSPIWLGAQSAPLSAGDEAHVTPDVQAVASKAGGADGGRSKAIAAHLVSPDAQHLWTAESGHMARSTNVETGATVQQLRGHGGPVSGVASMLLGEGRALLFTSSWDRAIRVWAQGPTLEARPAPLTVLENAGSDLLKTLHVNTEFQVLLSGGSDKVVRVWDISALAAWAAARSDEEWTVPSGRSDKTAPRVTPRPALLTTLCGHTRPVVSVTTLGRCPERGVVRDVPTDLVAFTADSMGRLLEVHVSLSEGAPRSARCTVVRELEGPETNVLCVAPVWRPYDEDEDGPQWTADVWVSSSDCTVRRFALSEAARGALVGGRVSRVGERLGTEPALYADLLWHTAEPVKSVLPLGVLDIEPRLDDVVVTGGSDGTLLVWRISTGTISTELEGHWHQVTHLAPWRRHDGSWWVISTSLDGTVRRWPLARVLVFGQITVRDAPTTQLTAEEEAELAELME